jgi:hypothetical protein
MHRRSSQDPRSIVDRAVHESVYVTGEYLAKHPSWGVENSSWKARQILRMIARNGLSPRTICEVGCGAGEILRQLQLNMNVQCTFHGYEISPQAYKLCQQRANDKLRFHLGDFLEDEQDQFDLILLIDMIEHLEDCYGFLRQIRPRSDYKILHIPLDLSVETVLRVSRMERMYNPIGHLHYFTKETALRTLGHCGYRVLDWFYTQGLLELPVRTRLARLARPVVRLMMAVDKDWTVRLVSSCSLMVLVS